ncbi:MAG: deoxyribose-phosphate aldolase [Bacteroidales bacterium]|nr:deoxyribose-phosphate aldolase [Bacteroidales bacterium]
MKFEEYTQTGSSIQKRIQAIESIPVDEINRQPALETLFSCLDLTTLEGTDNKKKINGLCDQALGYRKLLLGKTVAAVCVYSPFVRQAKAILSGSEIKVATVACAFPSGQLPLHLKIEEVKWAVAEGADEIDMVISRGKMLEGDFDAIYEEVSQVKKACGSAHLKVILETGELQSVQLIRKACELAIEGGADFLKTSTGKVSPAATPEAVVIMLDTIKEYYHATNIKIGLKPAGGISEPVDALLYYQLVREIVGKDWLNNTLFRIGASRLADKLKNLLAD